jgi:hypothetical protein
MKTLVALISGLPGAAVVLAMGIIMVTFTIIHGATYALGLDGNDYPARGLHLYSKQDITRFLKSIGHPEFGIKASWDIARNADGSALIFFDWAKNRGVAATSKGTVKEIALPGKATWTNRPIWLDDEFRCIAWYENGKLEILGDISRTGISSRITKVNPTGEFFMKAVNAPDNKNVSIGTDIYSIVEHTSPLVRMMEFHGEKMFLKDGRLFVFGSYVHSRDEETVLYILQQKDGQLIQQERVIIRRPQKSPAPFCVEDLSPWSDEVLFSDVFDFPSRSKWYVYNIAARTMKQIGKESFNGAWGFYLQSDIVNGPMKR